MNRRTFLAALGSVAGCGFLTRAASAKTVFRDYQGDMTVAGVTTPLALALITSTGRNRLVTGKVWLGDDVHGVHGRLSADRRRITLSAGLENNKEIRLEGRISAGGRRLTGRVTTCAGGSPVGGGTFVLGEV